MANPGRIQASSGSQRALWGMHAKQKNPSRIQAQTCQPQAKKTPAVQPQTKKPQHIATTSETRKPQQDSSPRGSHFVLRRAAETASGKPLKAKQNHGKPWQDSSLKRKSKGSVGHACETEEPQQDSSPNLPKPSPVKLSNVAF